MSIRKLVGLVGAGIITTALVGVIGLAAGEHHAQAQAATQKMLTMGDGSGPALRLPITADGVSIAHNTDGWEVFIEGRAFPTNYRCIAKVGSLSDALELQERITADKTTNVDCRGAFTAPAGPNRDSSRTRLADLTVPNSDFGINSNP
jgi:hypothetical protein